MNIDLQNLSCDVESTAVHELSLKLLQEFIAGCATYYGGTTIASEQDMEFFLRHEHQKAVDDRNDDEFYKCFPNFHQYINHDNIFYSWVNCQ